MIEYSNTAANARLAAGLTATGVPGQSVDGNTGPGQLVIGTSALAGATGVLATLSLPKPCGTIASRVWTLAGVPINVTPTASGVAALGELRDSAGTTIINGLTVGTAGTDIIVSTTTFSTSVPVSVQAGNITHP
jgi:hypothetical protein